MRWLRPFGILTALVLGITVARGQASLTIVQGGTAAITEQDPVESSGYRLALGWELMPTEERLTLGASLGLVNISGTRSSLGTKTAFRMSTIPILAVSRLMFGGKKLNVFVRIGLGAHSMTTTFETATATSKSTGWGMAAVTAGGVMYWLGKKTFVSGDYEWLWLGSTHPNMGSVGSFSLSAGFKL
jgi:hypothetical protein